jgi:hypothetical protein
MVVLMIILIAGAVVLCLALDYFYNRGQIGAVTYIAEKESFVLHLSSRIEELRTNFSHKLNFTELLYWESLNLVWDPNRKDFHSDPIEILNCGRGACGEFSILYVSICLANDIPARLVTPGYFIPNVADHAWAEVNPSKDGTTWRHVDPSDACKAIRDGKSLNGTIDNMLRYKDLHYKMVLAYQLTEDRQVIMIDRTSVYSPDG